MDSVSRKTFNDTVSSLMKWDPYFIPFCPLEFLQSRIHWVEGDNFPFAEYLDVPWRIERGHVIIYHELLLPVVIFLLKSSPSNLPSLHFSSFWTVWLPLPWKRLLSLTVKKTVEAYFSVLEKLKTFNSP